MKTLRSSLFVSLCLLLSLVTHAGDKASFLKKQFTTANGYKLNYRILYPKNYCPEQKYPVILFLHGAGERGSDNEAQLVHGGNLFASDANRTQYPAIIIAPQCPEEDSWLQYTKMAPGQKRSYPAASPASRPLSAAKELLDSYIANGSVDTKRIHVTGLSMGGMGSFDLLCRYPALFATATPICGAVNLDRAARYKGKTAIRIYHGSADDVVDPQFSRDAFETLKKANADVQYKEYPEVKHNSWNNAFAEPDYLSWMLQHNL